MGQIKASGLTGVIPILPTPFLSTGEVDESSFRRVIDAAIEDGVHALAMFGLASEYAKLEDREKKRLTQILVEQAGGRVPVIVSITHHSLEVAKKEAADAMQAGVDALIVMPPFFMAPGLEAVRAHIATIAAETGAPLIVQYAPIQTGINLNAEVLAELNLQHSNVEYVKVDLIPSGPMISKLRAASHDRLKTMVGYMGLHLPHDLARGAVAVMPTVSVSRAFVNLVQLLRTDEDKGWKLHQRLLPLLNFMMQSVEMLVRLEKLLLEQRGLLQSSYCRAPSWIPDPLYNEELHRFRVDLKDLLP